MGGDPPNFKFPRKFTCGVRIFGGDPPKLFWGVTPQISSFVGRSNLVLEFLGGHPPKLFWGVTPQISSFVGRSNLVPEVLGGDPSSLILGGDRIFVFFLFFFFLNFFFLSYTCFFRTIIGRALERPGKERLVSRLPAEDNIMYCAGT